MKYLYYIIYALTLASLLPLNAQFRQVLVDKNSVGSELSIAISPGYQKKVLAATSSGFYLSNYDTARTWSMFGLDCGNAKFKLYKNPLTFWSRQDLYNSYVSGKDSIVMKIDFRADQFYQGGCYHIKMMPDKTIERLMIYSEPETDHRYAVWTQLDNLGSKNQKDSSFIFYAFSSQRGIGWDKMFRVSAYGGDCSMGDSTLMGASCCTGPGHEVYATWAGPRGLMFRNLADTNLLVEKTIVPIKNGWQYTVGKNIPSNGLPTIACDLSGGEHKGRLYVCWSDEKHGVHNKNVFIIYSDDRGENWTEPIVVTYRPNHKEQFMPYMTIDQSTGYIYILYYDQQNFPDGDLTDLYLAQSKNGGLKFDYYKVNTMPLKPHSKLFFGNHFGLSAVDGIIRPIWMQTDKKNKTNIYTALIDEGTLMTYNKEYSEDMEIQKTFSWSDKIKIDLVLRNNSDVSAIITKPLETGFEKVVFKNKKLKKGKNNIFVDTKSLGLQKGNYTLTLYYNHKNTFVWIMEE